MVKYSFRQRAGRVVKKVIRKGYKMAKKRYINKKGNFRLSRLAKDVAMVKRVINVEKKRNASAYTGVVGQVNGAGGGAAMIDITPTISQGVAVNERTGNSVKLTGCYIQGQFLQQGNTLDSNKFSVEIWCHKNKEVPMSLASTGTEIYNPSPFSGQIDLVSQRSQDYFSDYVCIKKQLVYVKGDQYSTTNIVRNATFNMPVKLNRHLRWNNSGTLIQGQLFMIIRAQNGNCSLTTASTANIAHQGVATGYSYGINSIFYNVDN